MPYQHKWCGIPCEMGTARVKWRLNLFLRGFWFLGPFWWVKRGKTPPKNKKKQCQKNVPPTWPVGNFTFSSNCRQAGLEIQPGLVFFIAGFSPPPPANNPYPPSLPSPTTTQTAMTQNIDS